MISFSILQSCLLAVSTNLDNLSVGVALGATTQVSWMCNLVIALLSFFSTFVSLAIGEKLLDIWPSAEVQITQLSSAALLLVSFYLLKDALSTNSGAPAHSGGADNQFMEVGVSIFESNIKSGNGNDSVGGPGPARRRKMSLREATALGVALTLTNFATGCVGGVARLDLFVTSTLSMLSSLATIGGGVLLGHASSKLAGSQTPAIVAALMLSMFAVSMLLT